MAKDIRTSTPLSTLTDLKPEEVSKVAEAVNPLIADAFAVYPNV